MSIRLVIADDDALIRESLKIILSYDRVIDVVEVFENGKDLVDFLFKNEVDIALVPPFTISVFYQLDCINGKVIINNKEGFGVIILIPYLGDIWV